MFSRVRQRLTACYDGLDRVPILMAENGAICQNNGSLSRGLRRQEEPMHRLLFIGVMAVLAAPLYAGDDPGVKQTIAYVQKLQTSTGGFLAMAPQPNIRLAPNLRSTSAGVRALHYWGGEIADKAAAIKYVESCWNKAAGGFSNLPKGRPMWPPTGARLLLCE